MSEARSKFEYMTFFITLNTNRFYRYIIDEERLKFYDFATNLFKENPEDILALLEWSNVGRGWYRNISSEAPAYRVKIEDICFLESSLSFEVGKKTGKLHCHCIMSVKYRKDPTNDLAIYPYSHLISLLYEQEFGQKAHVDIKHNRAYNLGQRIYILKSFFDSEDLSLNDESEVKNIVFYNYKKIT